ncbi:Protein CNPPD1 [Pseudolycoriella hygida]|uniref:Protein CNPPD1 n=1 Tax=Pseudolycoriella hygida TaxID=35572 RepID=A0A9Q0NEF7_9DIPT|nr:Protein CNPPD1 [Pseudolycoriella hygida]
MTKYWRLRNDARNVTKQIMPHDEFIKRIQKTLYSSSMSKCQISRPLSVYASDVFNSDHRGYSLNRLSYVTVGNLRYATPCSLLLSMIYLDRLRDIDPMYSKRITPTELFLVSMMVSTKFYCGYDEDVYLSDWTEQGEITQDHLKQLEIQFLCAINWNLFVSNKEFFEKLKFVETEIAKRQGLERGWLTYTELSNLLPSLAIAKAFLQHTSIFVVSYAASVVTIAGAFFLASKVPGTALYSSLSKSETMKLNEHIIVNDTSSSTHLLDKANDIGDGCCDFDDVLFERLKDDLLENTTVSERPSIENQTTILAPGVANISKINLVPYSYVGFQSGINLRSYLDDNRHKVNDSYITNLHDVPVQSLCRNFGNLVTWMKLI